MNALNILTLTAVTLAGAALLNPQTAYAWGEHDSNHLRQMRHQEYTHEYHHPRIGFYVDSIPKGCFSIRLGGSRYFYKEGVYYRPHGRRYVVVEPTIIVKPTPVLVSAPEKTKTVTKITGNIDETYTINIPNEETGGYTEVTLKRIDKGFIGPQGEFYPEFPRVEQLKVMYVK